MANYIFQTNREQTRFQETAKYPEGLVDLGQNCYAWLVPNGSWGEANAGLVVGDGESLLIDTLWDLNYAREMLSAMQPITANALIRQTVNTHADGDHFFGNELVSDTDIITSQAALNEMQRVKPSAMLALKRVGGLMKLFSNRRAGHYFQQMAAPYDFRAVKHTPAHRAFSGEITLVVGGREVKLIEAGPAHTQGDLMVYVPDAKILYSGDILFIESTPVMWAGPISNWIKALDRILEMDVDVIVPGHGPLTDKDGVKRVRTYWQFVDTELRLRRDMGMDAEKAVIDVVRSVEFQRQPFSKWNSPERIMTSAHVHFRHIEGNTKPLKPRQIIGILAKQAVLANKEFPNAQPEIMRRK
ncbi:MAG: MBL fold metallo-hydrolase [Chloroflexi bacterium]|nr:MBL fold metallo-hydrolase [Chloroflexota bacterium]